MLVGNANLRPDFSIYYWGSKFIEFFQKEEYSLRPNFLFEKFRKKSGLKIGYDNFVYILDFLFIIGYIKLNDKGEIKKCS
jgi:hypothetical protein